MDGKGIQGAVAPLLRIADALERTAAALERLAEAQEEAVENG